MSANLDRRQFLKLSAVLGAALILPDLPHSQPWPPSEVDRQLPMLGRVATRAIYFYSDPQYSSQHLGILRRDTLLDLRDELVSPDGPAFNPRWYALSEGFVHSGYIQRVDEHHLNRVLDRVPEEGLLGEITVPFSQAYRQVRDTDWQELYRLYYGSVHWITALQAGPDGAPWYELTDELLHVRYCVPASHVRPVAANELTPLSPEVPEKEKTIVVSVSEQILTAFEGDLPVMRTQVSSGVRTKTPPVNGIPTETPEGHFRISVKVPSKHMGDGKVTADPEAYELLGVPWVSFFHQAGIALHGTYWHDNFGHRMSHGCVNLRNADAKWIYRWCTPPAGAQDRLARGAGTRVAILDESS